MSEPMKITIYSKIEGEEPKSFSQMFVPWKLLKVAMKLVKHLDADNMTDADIDELAGLVCETFGNRFSVEDLNTGADMGEMMGVLNAIISKAAGAMANPTQPGK